MAELPEKGRHAKRHKPSRLRNEIRPESTNDKRDTQKHVVQVPHSDTIVLETQLDDNGRFDATDFDLGLTNKPDDGEVPLSPRSAAMLERNTATKKTQPPESTPLTIKLLSKIDFSKRVDSSSVPSFSFGRPTKASSKTSPNVEIATTQSIAGERSTREQRWNDTSNGSSTIAAPETYSPPGPPHQLSKSVLEATDAQDADDLPQLPHVPDAVLCEPVTNYAVTPQSVAASDAPPSAQPSSRLTDGTRKIRTTRKRKKGKKGVPTQQHGGPWPPRPANGNHTTHQIAQAAVIENTMPETFADPRDLSQADPQEDQQHSSFGEGTAPRNFGHICPEDVHDQAAHTPENSKPQGLTGHNMETHGVGHDVLEDMQSPAAYTPQDPDSGNVQCDMPPFYITQDMPSTMSQQPPGNPVLSASRAPPVEDDPSNSEQPAILEPEQQPVRGRSDSDYREAMSHGQHAMPSLQEANFNSPSRIDRTTESVPMSMNRPASSEIEMMPGQASPQQKRAEAVLHETSGRHGLYRVSKPRKKPRAVGGPLPHDFQTPSVSENVERSLGNLRMAMLADSFRIQHEHTVAIKQYTELSNSLNSTIDAQKKTIAGYEQKNDDLKRALSRLEGKAETNQKYVIGLQKDHEKLKKSFTSLENQNKKILQAKISEIENEKATLRRDFEATIETLGRSQKNLKSTIDDIYMRLVISDSKKKGLEEDLSKQEKMYEGERRKRDHLEKQLLSGAQSIQRQLGDGLAALVNKLELLQSSVDAIAADDAPNEKIKECLTALQNLQSTPFLTTKDVQKADGMLRFVHDRIDSRLSALTEAIESKEPPNEELQTFIKQQLRNFQMEMAKYEEIVVENRKVNESNDTLRKQTEAQHQHCARLEEQINDFQRAEADLKARTSQLERDLDDLKDATQNPQTGPSELEQAMLNLRGQLGKAELDLKAANGKVDRVEQERKGLEQEAAKYKKQYETAKAGLLKFDAESKVLCEKITKSCQSDFKAKEDDLNDTIQRLEHTHHEKEQIVEELQNQLDATKNQFDALHKDSKTLESHLDVIRKEKALTEAKLETVQSDSSSQLSEITNLKERLQQKTEELGAKTRDYTEAERQRADISNKLTDLESSRDRLQAQVSQQLLTIETVRQETDDRLSEVREEAQGILQSVRDEVSCLQQEKQNLLFQLEHARSNETKLNNVQATFSTECADLQQQVAELRAELGTKDAAILRIQADATENIHKLADTHRSEVADWSRRFLQSDAALKETEAKHRLAEDQFHAKLAADHKLAETKLLDAEQRYLKALQAVKDQSSPGQQLTSDHAIVNENTSEPSKNTYAGKARKKVNRNNHSVLGVGQNISIEQGAHAKNSQAFQTEIPSTQRNDFTLFEEQAEAETMFVEPGLYLIDPEAEDVPETQEVGSLNMSREVFHERLAQASQQGKKRQNRGSTDLSSIESDELRQMQMEMQPMSLRGHDLSSSKHGYSQKHAQKTPMNSDSASVAGSRSSQSQDRPRSQANTASRMMPPPKNISQHSQSHIEAEGSVVGVANRYPVNEQRNDSFSSSSSTNTPDFVHQAMSTSKHSYSQHDSRLPTRTGSRQSTPRVMEKSRLEKRKSPTDLIEKDTGAKKQRTSSQSYPIASSSGSRNGSYRSSIPDSRATKPAGSSYMQGVYSATSREKTRGSSSSVQPRTSSQFPSSSNAYSSRRQQSSCSQVQTTAPMRRVSSRVTRSASRNGTGFDARFDMELGPSSRL